MQNTNYINTNNQLSIMQNITLTQNKQKQLQIQA